MPPARSRLHREALSLLVDAALVAACWNVTCHFRPGFERWMSARPAYDAWVLLDIAAATGLPVLTVPSAAELREGQARVGRLRSIEPDELPGRGLMVLGRTGVAQTLQGKCLLVSGAGRSIGSELRRQAAKFKPARLVLVDLSEFNLQNIEQGLAEAFPALELVRRVDECAVKTGVSHNP